MHKFGFSNIFALSVIPFFLSHHCALILFSNKERKESFTGDFCNVVSLN